MKILNFLKGKSKGFTLIELLVVIAIIGILAAVVLVSLNSARAKSRDAKRLADVRQVMTAMELFYNDNNSYPDDGGVTPDLTDGAPAFNTFLSQWPTTPTPNDGTCTAAQNTYTYIGIDSTCLVANLDATDPACYNLTFCLGAPTGGLGTAPDTAVTCTASPNGLVCT